MTITSDEIRPYLKLKGKPINSAPAEKMRKIVAHLPPRVLRAMLAAAFPNIEFNYKDGRFEVERIETDIPPLPRSELPTSAEFVALDPR